MNIKKFKDYTFKVNENGASWGLSSMSSQEGGSESPRDKDMALDAYDTFNSNLKYTMNRFVSLSKSIFGSPDSRIYTQYAKSILDDISNIYIQNIVNKDGVSINIYLRFELGGETFHAKIENFENETNWTLSSNFLRIPQIRNVSDIAIRFKQIIKTVLDDFFEIEKGAYYLNIDISMYNFLGELKHFTKGTELLVTKVLDKQIYLVYNNQEYTISDNLYYLFHYYFSKKKTNLLDF